MYFLTGSLSYNIAKQKLNKAKYITIHYLTNLFTRPEDLVHAIPGQNYLAMGWKRERVWVPKGSIFVNKNIKDVVDPQSFNKISQDWQDLNCWNVHWFPIVYLTFENLLKAPWKPLESPLKASWKPLDPFADWICWIEFIWRCV